MREQHDTGRAGAPGAEEAPRGFSFQLDGGRALLRLEGEPVGGLAKLDALEMRVPNLTLPFDITRGVGGLRNRRLVLHRLALSARVGALAAAASSRARGPLTGGLAACASDGAITVLAELGPEGRRVHATFRLVPGPPGGELSFAVDEARCYGPLGAPLTGAPFEVLAAVGWFRLDGADARPSSLVQEALRAILPPRGWRIPDAGGAALARVALGEDLCGVEYVARGEEPAAAGQPGAGIDWLRRCEELRAVREGDRLLARGALEEAREAYARAAARDPGSPAAAARLASIDLASGERRRAARAAIAAARARFPERTDLLAAAAHGAALDGDDRGEVEVLSLLSASSTPLERYAAGLRLGRLLSERDPARAQRCFEDALAARGEDAAALGGLARLAGAAGDRRRFDALARRWVSAAGDAGERAAAQAGAGAVLSERFGDGAAAARRLELAVAEAPADRALRVGLARAAASCGDLGRAMALLDEVERGALADGDPAGAAAALAAAGRIWLAASEPGLAAARFREALALGAGSEELRRAIGEGLAACGPGIGGER